MTLPQPDNVHDIRPLVLAALMREREVACDFELFRKTPTVADVRACMRRGWTLHSTQELDAKRKDPNAVVPVPRVWVITTGRPTGALGAFRVERETPWPRGIYVTHPEVGLGVVVLAELAEVRETLSLRMLGRGTVLARACRELAVLPADAWERRLIEILVRWRAEIPVDPSLRTPDEEDFVSVTDQAFEEFKESFRAEGRKEALKDGLRKGIAKGLAPLEHQFARRLKRATLRARLKTHGPERLGDVVLDLAPRALAKWLADPNAT